MERSATTNIGIRGRRAELRDAHEQLHRARTRDPLTGLLNRAGLIEWYDERSARSSSIAVWLISVDRLAHLHDTLGPTAGDEILAETARRIQRVLAVTDTHGDHGVARLSADRFAAVAVDAPPAIVDALSSSLLSMWTEPGRAGGQTVHTTISIGQCTRPPGSTDLDATLDDGHLALQQARRSGGAHLAIFQPALRERADLRAGLAAELRDGIERDEFELYHQPVVDLSTGRVVAAECLLRWNHPDRGVLIPADFLDIADENGLLPEIGRRTIRSTCRRFATLNRSTPWPLGASLNLSARELRIPDLSETVDRALRAAGLNPTLLSVEVSESLAGGPLAIDALSKLRSLGVGVLIDDFGTGYSSLGRLADLPVTGIKIDSTFVSSIGVDGARTTIAGAMIDIGTALDLEVTAEGVSSEVQADWLRARGCGRAQGWLYGRPTNFAKLTRIVTSFQLPVGEPGSAVNTGPRR